MIQKDYDEILDVLKNMYGTKSNVTHGKLIKCTISNLSDKDKVLDIIKVVHELAYDEGYKQAEVDYEDYIREGEDEEDGFYYNSNHVYDIDGGYYK